MDDADRQRKELSLFFLAAIFLLNDYLFIPARGYAAWLLIDYASRISAIGIIIYLIKTRMARPSEFGLVTINLKQGIAWSIVLTLTGILIDQVGWRFFMKVLPATQLISAYPKITNRYVDAFDLTVGIVLVSVSEELIFRGYFYSVVKHYVKKPFVLVVLSAFVFGLIHWSMGLHAIVTTAIWGILPMVVMVRTGSVIPALIAHYLTDVISLSSVIPVEWFNNFP